MNLVSVVIATYNYGKYIKETIESCLKQTYKNIEIIVVDDGSTDDTKNVVLENFRDSVKYIYTENVGQNKAVNLGLTHVTGDYIALLDADDIWDPTKIEKQISFFNTYKDVGLIFTDFCKFNEQGILVHSHFNRLRHFMNTQKENLEGNWYILDEDFFSDLLIQTPIFPSTVIFKKEILAKKGPFLGRYKQAEDLEFFLRYSRICRFGMIDEILTHNRFHEKNLTADLFTTVHSAAVVLEYILHNYDDLGEKEIRRIKYSLSDRYFSCGYLKYEKYNFAEAREYFIKSLFFKFKIKCLAYYLFTLFGKYINARLRKIKQQVEKKPDKLVY